MTKPIKIAVIGCGRVAQHYKKILDSGVVSNWKIVGFFDLISERSNSFATHFDTKAFDSFDEMLKASRPDLVLILTPSGLHYQHTKIALEHNCNVLVEKPVTMLPNQAIELEKIAAHHSCKAHAPYVQFEPHPKRKLVVQYLPSKGS